MLRKRFKLKKKNVVITTIMIIVLFICNIVFALASNCTHKSDVLTVISGWISGISTTVLGLIAIKQTSNYDELSNFQKDCRWASGNNCWNASKLEHLHQKIIRRRNRRSSNSDS